MWAFGVSVGSPEEVPSQGSVDEYLNGSFEINSSTARPPVFNPPPNQSAGVGIAQSFNLGSFTDSGSGPWNVSINWGDNTLNTLIQVESVGPIGFQSHNYALPGSYNVFVTITDEADGQSATVSFGTLVFVPLTIEPSATSSVYGNL
jgi:hypothetical protein